MFFVVRDGRAEARTAALGPREGAFQALLSGGSAGDSAVVMGQGRLVDGSPVRVEVVQP